MTSRELIIYILKNNLEGKEFFKDGLLNPELFLSVDQVAMMFDVGVQTVRAWYVTGKIDGVWINHDLYIYKDVKDPRKEQK